MKKFLGLLTPPVIIPYRGYGTPEQIFLHGHVLDDRILHQSYHQDKRKKNMKAMLSRYLSEGIPNLNVAITFNEEEMVVKTDRNGHFKTWLKLKEKPKGGWHKVSYQVLDQIVENQGLLEETGDVFVEDGSSEYTVVSDVDDTLLISHATQTLKKLRLILTKNAKTRLPFTGVAAFYHALQAGTSPDHNNPIFYVSSSEWNLYDFLEDFCKVRQIPKGPFLLQEMKTSLWDLIKSGGGSHHHKLQNISALLALFPQKRFILIGDSGQRDAQLYKTIAQENPGRILTIYIRDVGKKKRAKKVIGMADNVKGAIEMVLVKDSYEAALHAHGKGYITQKQLENVRDEFDAQLKKPTTLIGQVIENQKPG